jgi:hypothetical protein
LILRKEEALSVIEREVDALLDQLTAPDRTRYRD